MYMTRNVEMAKERAREKDLLWGLCVFNGAYYVGTAEQLYAIGCMPGVA